MDVCVYVFVFLFVSVSPTPQVLVCLCLCNLAVQQKTLLEKYQAIGKVLKETGGREMGEIDEAACHIDKYLNQDGRLICRSSSSYP